MKKILIIEDDQYMLRMYTKIFSYEDFSVETGENGEEGLFKAKFQKPDIILLDIMMPKVNGFQVLEALKNDPALKDIPVIMLTNLAGDQDVQEAMSKGARKYIVKSNYSPKQLLELVNDVLSSEEEEPGKPAPAS